MKFHSDKARLEKLSAEECLFEMYPVSELAPFSQPPFPGSALLSVHLYTCLPFCRLILPQVAVCIGGRLLPALQPSAMTQTEEVASPAGVQGNASVTSANRLKKHRGQLSDLTLSKCCKMKSEARHNALLVNHKLGKISGRFKQYGQASSAPVWT